MRDFDAGRIARLIAVATGSLNSASPWLVATCIPEQKAALLFDSEMAARVQAWTQGEVANWPAPIKVGEHLAQAGREKLAFTPKNCGRIASEHYCELHADGASLIAVQIGKRREATESQDAVWAIGEGAIAWLSVTLARFAAEWASQAKVLGQASFDLRIFSSAAPEDQQAVQLWNFASGTDAPASDALQMTRPSQRVVDLRACLSTEVTLIARSLLLPVLAQFGHDESRHIDATGTITSANFAGHAPLISAWARVFGVAHR